MPLTDQKAANQSMEVEKPNKTFIMAVAMRPPARRKRGDVREPRTPDRNLDVPYMMGKIEVRAPMSVMESPSILSATIAGAVYVKLLRVK